MKKSSIVVAFFAFFSMSALAQEKKWTLEECVNHAIVNNNAIKQALLDADIIQIAKQDAIGSFLPNVNANGSHSWNIGLNQNITTGLLENQTSQFSALGANMSLDIYKGLQNVNQLRKANLNKIASQYQLTKIKEDITLNVVNAYLQILFNKENLKVQKEQLAFDAKQLQRTTELIEAGVVPKGDLLDLKATVASDNQKLVVAENSLLLSKLSLSQLLQLKDYEQFDIAEALIDVKLSPSLLENPNSIITKAKQTRTEMKLAQTNLQIAERDVKIANGAFQPTVQVFYSLNTRVSYSDRILGIDLDSQNPTKKIGLVKETGQVVIAPNFVSVLGGAAPIWEQIMENKGHSFGVQINIPIFNGFSVRNNVSRSKIAFQKAKLALEQQELDLERTIYTAYTDTQGAEKAYESANVTLEARQNAMNYAKERYEVGLMNVFDYNQAQTLFVNAQSEVLRTKYDYIFRTKILEFYFGIPIAQKLK